MVLAPAFSVPFLWLGGAASLDLASRDRRLRGGRWIGLGGVVAIFVGIVYLPALGSTVMGAFPDASPLPSGAESRRAWRRDLGGEHTAVA